MKHGNLLELFFFFFLSFSAWILITGLNLQPWEREGSNVQVTGGRGGGNNRKDSRASFRVKSSTGVWIGRCWQRAVLPCRPGCVQSSWGGGVCAETPRPALAPQRDSCSAAVVPSFPHRCLDAATSLSPCTGGLGYARACRNTSRNKVEVFLNTLFVIHSLALSPLLQPCSHVLSLCWGWHFLSVLPSSQALPLPQQLSLPRCPSPWPLSLTAEARRLEPSQEAAAEGKGDESHPASYIVPRARAGDVQTTPSAGLGNTATPAPHPPAPWCRTCHFLAAPTRAASRVGTHHAGSAAYLGSASWPTGHSGERGLAGWGTCVCQGEGGIANSTPWTAAGCSPCFANGTGTHPARPRTAPLQPVGTGGGVGNPEGLQESPGRWLR